MADDVKAISLRGIDAADGAGIDAVLRSAFGREAEARLVRALRAEGHACLELVATAAEEIVGHVMLSRLWIVPEEAAGQSPGGPTAAAPIPALAVAPVAVAAAWQRRGIGSALILAALAQATQAGERIAIVLGDPKYYSRFGFSAAAAAGLQSPYAGPEFQLLALDRTSPLDVGGRAEYPAPFARLES